VTKLTKAKAIERLEALLERVRARARPLHRATDPTSDPIAEDAELEVIGVTYGAAAGAWSTPDQAESDTDFAEVEVATAESATDEAPVSEEHDSRERLVVAELVAFEAPEPAAAPASASPIDVAELEVGTQGEVATQEEVGTQAEQPPASSRRPVALQPEERLAEMAFGTDEPPQRLHTPPPESGRVPAAPAAGFDVETDETGVRSSPPFSPRATEAFAPELVPEAKRPQLVPSDSVAEVIAEAQRFAPSTFVELLDASLSL
jgi:hypothetical protein